MKDYIVGGLSSKIKDPDGRIHIVKAKASLGLNEKTNAKILKENFLVDGFAEDLNILPAISYGRFNGFLLINVKKRLLVYFGRNIGFPFLTSYVCS